MPKKDEKKIDRTVAESQDEDSPAAKRLRRTKDMLPGQFPGGPEGYGPGNEKGQAEHSDGRVAAHMGRGLQPTRAIFQRSRASSRFSNLGSKKDRVPEPDPDKDGDND